MELKNGEKYPQFCHDVMESLKTSLPDELYYHRPEHTLDVANVCENYIERLNIPEEDALLLRVAAIAHDYGYVNSYRNHEEEGVRLITPILKSNNFSEEQIEEVQGMIMATKVPQQPHNLLQKILADADLDYLGREDYHELSERLYKEFKANGIIQDEKEWLETQIEFLIAHQFHTNYAIKNREGIKADTLRRLKEKRKPVSLWTKICLFFVQDKTASKSTQS